MRPRTRTLTAAVLATAGGIILTVRPAPTVTAGYCACLDVRTVPDALRDLADELAELPGVRHPTGAADELSDISWAVGRLLGSVLGRPYLRVPGDRRHTRKIASRMRTHGCVRSRRHLTAGRCPSSTRAQTEARWPDGR